MDEIRAAIPHREPFLFADRVVERTERSIVTEWRPSPDAPFFRGHYPGAPIVPGVLICECALQAGALLCAADPDAGRGTPMVTRIADARFKRVVRPGETLRCEVVLDERVGHARYMTARVTCAGETVLRAQFVVALAQPAAAGGA